MTTPATRPRGQRDLAQARRTVVVAAGIAAVVIAADHPFLGVLAIARRGLVVASFLPWRLTTYSRPADALPGVVPYRVAVIPPAAIGVCQRSVQRCGALAELMGEMFRPPSAPRAGNLR